MTKEVTTMDMLVRIDGKLDKMNGRVRSLEIWRGRIQGAIALLTAVLLPIGYKVFFGGS